MKKVTVFTPTYNRIGTLHRVYDSLVSQTFTDFEWIVVDDGSTDGTKELIDSFCSNNNSFEIKYVFQRNQGKHVATNTAIKMADSEFFITLDSDDGCKSNALELFLDTWNSIPSEIAHDYKGIACRCCLVETPDKIIGDSLPTTSGFFDSNDIDIRLKYKINGELWGMTLTSILKENLYPVIEGLKFFPENIYWGNIGLKYKTRYIDIPLRYYYYDNDNITKKLNYKELFYIREWYLNVLINQNNYFPNNPVCFMKQSVGFVRDGLLSNYSSNELFSKLNNRKAKFLFCVFWSVGFVLYKDYIRKSNGANHS